MDCRVILRKTALRAFCPAMTNEKNKRKRNAGRRKVVLPARKRRAGRATKGGLRRPPLAGALACRRSTAVLASGTFVPKAQRRARLPESGAKCCGLSRQRR